jgi:ataxia telangiectasia mutated family protein
MQNYLKPAILALKGKSNGPDAGLVLHEFAFFCDKQLQNPDATTDFERVTKAKERRKKEVDAYKRLVLQSKAKSEKEKISKEYKMSKRWYDIDEQEYQRILAVRQSLMAQCLENYLRSLTAWDLFDNDVLRFFSVWLEFSDDPIANDTVSQHLANVPSSKFALLMNQLTSILQKDGSAFQKHLQDLLFQICVDHPFHSLHHIYAGSNTSSDGDQTAISRKAAFKQIGALLSTHKDIRREWTNLSSTDGMYHKLAMYQDKTKLTSGREVSLEATSPSITLMHKIKDFRVPPATLSVALRSDKDYRFVPRIVSFKPKMTIASGISCPKILTAIGTDGKNYKQLVS